MTVKEYREQIVEALQGRALELQDISRERLEWAGTSLILELYDEASGSDRDNVISAMKKIIEDRSDSPVILAQVVQIASALDISQLEPSVICLQKTSEAREEPLRSAINNYLAFRSFGQAVRAGSGGG